LTLEAFGSPQLAQTSDKLVIPEVIAYVNLRNEATNSFKTRRKTFKIIGLSYYKIRNSLWLRVSVLQEFD
jgi:hypothetical protein